MLLDGLEQATAASLLSLGLLSESVPTGAIDFYSFTLSPPTVGSLAFTQSQVVLTFTAPLAVLTFTQPSPSVKFDSILPLLTFLETPKQVSWPSLQSPLQT